MKKILLTLAALLMTFSFTGTASARHRCICTKIYKPVCARLMGSNKLKTFGNTCMARCQHAKICAKGRCKACPVFRLARPKPGCRYVWIMKGCCKYPKLICKVGPCPVFKLIKPRPGCRYIWIRRGRCKYPKLICKIRKPFCTKIKCRKCNKRCLFAKKRCYLRAKRFSYRDVQRVRRACASAGYKRTHRCLCAWAFRKASSAVILRGMRGCLLKRCKKFRCCKIGRKLCYPHAPNVRCVKAPCCRKLVCDPYRCR